MALVKYFEIFVCDEKSYLLDFLKNLKGYIWDLRLEVFQDFPWYFQLRNLDLLISQEMSKWSTLGITRHFFVWNSTSFWHFWILFVAFEIVHCGTQRKEKGSSRKEKLFPSHVISLHIPWPQSKLINFDMYCTYWLKGWPG